MTYPRVYDERATLAELRAGASIARYGDGEFNLCAGRGIPCQRVDPVLSERLRGILLESGACHVGIPNLHSQTPKARFWSKYADVPFLHPDRVYFSAFISRPDSAPWIDTPDYWRSVESLWHGRDVVLVYGSGRSLVPEDVQGAASVRAVTCDRRDAFAHYARLLDEIGTPDLAVLCLGPTATVLAVDLCAQGVQAIDLGHVGMFLRKHRQGQPMAMTAQDHAA